MAHKLIYYLKIIKVYYGLTKMFKHILLQSMRFTGYTVGVAGSSVAICVGGRLIIRDIIHNSPKISKKVCLDASKDFLKIGGIITGIIFIVSSLAVVCVENGIDF
jgi:hypothetical protein